MPIAPNEIVDCHMHVGLIGNEWPQFGRFSDWYKEQITYKVFLLYNDIPPEKATDAKLHEAIVRTLSTTMTVNRIVCLALDPVYDRNGNRHEESSHVWTANEYVLKLRDEVGEKVLFGASVHPYRTDFEQQVADCVSKGAVLLKWLPSAQQFSLGDEKVGHAMKFLATAKGGKPLPLLLHCGPEYAIPTSDKKTWTYDFISWDFLDRVKNIFTNRYTPDIAGTEYNLRGALEAGAQIIFAHCGLPYFSSGIFGDLLEHSDFDAVKSWVAGNAGTSYSGRCYADVSALCTPLRKSFFPAVAGMPADYLLLGSDFPTPVFELYGEREQQIQDLKEVMKGHIEHLIIPAGNLLDVNVEQLRRAFPDHALFTNFAGKLV